MKNNGNHKILTAVLLLLVMLIIGNGLLSFMLEPYMGSSQEMWEKYAGHSAPDTICLGTSQGLSAVKPCVIDAELGTVTYNMSTNMQSPANSLAALKTVLKDQTDREGNEDATAAAVSADPDRENEAGKRGKKLSRVILILDYEVLRTKRSENFRADASFWHGRASVCSLPEKTLNATRFMTSDAFFGKPISLVYLAPWTYNRSASVADNMRRKLANNPDGSRDADGYEASYDVVDQSIPFVPASEAAKWSSEHPDLIHPELLQENRKILEEICRICSENSITLYPIAPPYPNCYNIYDLESYMTMDRDLEELFGNYGYEFLDFNAPAYEQDPELPATSDFKDVGHLNDGGAEKFSAYLAEYVLR